MCLGSEWNLKSMMTMMGVIPGGRAVSYISSKVPGQSEPIVVSPCLSSDKGGVLKQNLELKAASETFVSPPGSEPLTPLL